MGKEACVIKLKRVEKRPCGTGNALVAWSEGAITIRRDMERWGNGETRDKFWGRSGP